MDFSIAVVLVFIAAVLVGFVVVKSRKNYFSMSQSSAIRDRRFALRKGKSVYLKNYGVKVTFTKLVAPRMSIEEHTPKIVKLLVQKEDKGRQLEFDANKMRATRIQEAFGVRFHLLDLRNQTAVLSVE